MDTLLDQIKMSLDNNPNLNDDIRNKLFELTIVFHRKLPNISLVRLNERLKDVKINRMGKLERKGAYYYDVFKNEILFSKDLEGDYDIDNIFMKAILQMMTSTQSFTGFNSDDRLRALNLAYTEILANYMVGNEGVSDLEEEMLVTNLLSHIVGKDTMFNSYFSNNGEPIIRAMQEAEVGLYI